MDANNISEWWRSLPESIRLKLSGHGITDILQEPDTSVRADLYKYARLRAVGTEKDKDEEQSLLNEVACELSDLTLAGNNGMALEDMCNEDGEFLEEYQEQFDKLYDHYEETLMEIKKICPSTSYLRKRALEWDALPCVRLKTGKVRNWEQTMPNSSFLISSHS